jgi:uncharacterized membrane protein YccC
MIALGGALAGAAIFMWLRTRPDHQKSPVWLRKQKARLRAQYRRKLRSSKMRGREHAAQRRVYRRLLNMGFSL